MKTNNKGVYIKVLKNNNRLLSGYYSFHIVSFAEREGFEPPVQLPVHRISSAARSTTPASFLNSACKYRNYFRKIITSA